MTPALLPTWKEAQRYRNVLTPYHPQSFSVTFRVPCKLNQAYNRVATPTLGLLGKNSLLLLCLDHAAAKLSLETLPLLSLQDFTTSKARLADIKHRSLQPTVMAGSSSIYIPGQRLPLLCVDAHKPPQLICGLSDIT